MNHFFLHTSLPASYPIRLQRLTEQHFFIRKITGYQNRLFIVKSQWNIFSDKASWNMKFLNGVYCSTNYVTLISVKNHTYYK